MLLSQARRAIRGRPRAASGGVRVDEVTRNAHPSEEISGRREAPQGHADRKHAKAAISRRENLKRSADELKGQLNDAKDALSEAFEELKKVELLDERDQMRERAEAAAREQAELDAIGLMRVRNLPA